MPQQQYKQHQPFEFHDLRLKPSQETLQPARRLIQMVNRDPLFADAKRLIGIFPQVTFKLVKAAGIERTRMVTAFVIDLWTNGYFQVTTKGQYEPSLIGSQERARKALMSILYNNKPIFLCYAKGYFFEHFPQLRALVAEHGDQATA